MNKFLKKVLIFIVIPIILGISFFIFISLYVESTTKSINLKPNVTDLIMGDSHIECAINDSLLINSKNVAASAESYYFNYFKLKTILKTNKNIKRVYLGFSYHNLSSYYDDYIQGKKSNAISFKYFYYLPKEQQKNIILQNDDLTNYTKSLIKSGINIAKNKSEKDFIGGFSNEFYNTSATKKDIINRIQRQFYSNNRLNSFAKINLIYLNKIITLCKTSNIELVLVNTPLQSYYKRLIPNVFKVKYSEIIKSNEIKVINLNNLKFSDEYYINDGDHVSAKGAKLATEEFLKQKKLLPISHNLY
jgi:hypothetical protein